jgi:thioredoxin reductase
MMYDVIIVGGSYAGLSAGLQLARARRQVLVIDAGQRRNRFAATSHGFLGQDGQAPEVIAAEGRSQLMEYPTVTWVQGSAVQVNQPVEGFSVRTEHSGTFHARRLILATGVVDELPAVEGLKERWGTRVFHCPYCHGYELDQGRIGVLATSPLAMHHALMLPDWGPTTLFTNGVFTPDAEQQAQLDRRGVNVESAGVRRIWNWMMAGCSSSTGSSPCPARVSVRWPNNWAVNGSTAPPGLTCTPTTLARPRCLACLPVVMHPSPPGPLRWPWARACAPG